MTKEQLVVQLNPDIPPSGSDLACVNAARRSFGKRSEWANVDDMWINPFIGEVRVEMLNPEVKGVLKDKDKRLIEFLARGMTANDFEAFCDDVDASISEVDRSDLKEALWKWRHTAIHDTPFNHCHISFEVKAPIFVARQLVKTEYAPFSEYSRRYITDDVEFYIHDYREASEDKKQGSGGVHVDNAHWQKMAAMKNKESLDTYNQMISAGVAPEQARGQLPTDLMTSWTWSATLGAFAKMCRERLGSDAQMETRYVAEEVYKHLKNHFPVSAKCLVEGC